MSFDSFLNDRPQRRRLVGRIARLDRGIAMADPFDIALDEASLSSIWHLPILSSVEKCRETLRTYLSTGASSHRLERSLIDEYFNAVLREKVTVFDLELISMFYDPFRYLIPYGTTRKLLPIQAQLLLSGKIDEAKLCAEYGATYPNKINIVCPVRKNFSHERSFKGIALFVGDPGLKGTAYSVSLSALSSATDWLTPDQKKEVRHVKPTNTWHDCDIFNIRELNEIPDFFEYRVDDFSASKLSDLADITASNPDNPPLSMIRIKTK